MERAAWLKQMQEMAERLYDRFAPLYWVRFGLGASEIHQAFLQKLLARLPPGSTLLSAACGAGRYDGALLEAGHSVVGIDQSTEMLARARERFPGARYQQMRLQEIDVREAFHGATCIDAMEHIPPEDWPRILRRYREALKPGGILYFTANVAEAEQEMVAQAYERGVAQGLPVVYGEVADGVEEGFRFLMSYDDVFDIPQKTLEERADLAVYHYYPPLAQVRAWIGEAGLAIEEEGTGRWYEHYLVRRPTLTLGPPPWKGGRSQGPRHAPAP